MLQALLGKKIGMTQVFNDAGQVVPVTIIEAGPCAVTQIRTIQNDGYESVQLGFGRVRRPNKPEAGHLKGQPDWAPLAGSARRRHRRVRSGPTGLRGYF